MNKIIFTLDKCVVCGSIAGMDESPNGVICARKACRDGLSLTIQDLLIDRQLFEEEIKKLERSVDNLKDLADLIDDEQLEDLDGI